MRLLSLMLVPAMLAAVTAFGQDRLPPDGVKVVSNNTWFASDLYSKLSQKDGNLFFSPYSISTALAMTYAGARGDTAREMDRALHFDLDPNKLHPAFGTVMRETDAKGRKYKLQVANRLWGQKDYGFLPDFLKTTNDHYGAGLKEVDFVGATEEARKAINSWVEEQTQDKIKELLKPGILSVDTRLVLTNAIYFKAAWQRPFEPKNTRDGDFTLADGKKVQAKIMHGGVRTGMADFGDFKVLDLPYEQNDLSMLVILPSKADGLPAVEKQFDHKLLAKVSGRLGDFQVDVKLPRFKVTAEFLLNEQLKAMGMVKAFSAGQADFSGMTSREKLFISAVIHKAFVDVNEAGTEAAAATAVVMDRGSLPKLGVFHATHPFLFVIRDNRTGSVLFVGRVVNPV